MDEETGRDELTSRIDRLLSGARSAQVHRVLEDLRGELDQMHRALATRIQPLEEQLHVVATAVEEQSREQAERIIGGVTERMSELASLVAEQRDEIARRLAVVEGAVITAEPTPSGVDADDLRALIQAELASLADGIRRDIGAALRPVEPPDDHADAFEDLTRRSGEIAALVAEQRDEMARRLASMEEIVRAPASPVLVPAAFDADAVRELIREEVESLGVGIRTDIDAALRSGEEQSGQGVDALGLRITNFSMSLTQSLDAVRAQIHAVAERAEHLEAEHAAVLQAVRAEIEGLSVAAGGEAGARTTERLDAMAEQLGEVAAQTAARLASIEQLAASAAREAAAPDLEGIEQRLRALPEIAQRLEQLEVLTERVDALGPLRDDVRELSTAALQVGSLPQIEETLQRVESTLGGLTTGSERLSALARIEERLGALDPLPETLARLCEDAATLPSIREQLRDLDAIRTAMAAEPDLTGVVQRIDATLASIEGAAGADERRTEVLGRSLDAVSRDLERMAAGVQSIEHAIDALGIRSTAVTEELRREWAGWLAELESLVREDIRSGVAGLPETFRAGLSDGLAPLAGLGGAIARLDDAVARVDDRTALLPALHDRIASLPSAEAVAEAVGDRVEAGLAPIGARMGEIADSTRLDQVREGLQDVLALARANEEKLSAAREQLGGASDRVRAELAGLLEQLSIRLDGVEAAIARAIVEARSAFEGATAGSAASLERFGRRFQGLADHIRSLDGVTTAVREHLATLPSPDDIAATVKRDVAALVAPLQGDLGGVVTNVGEIWVRVRAVAQLLEQSTGSTTEQLTAALASAESTGKQLEQLARGEERTAARLGDLERRVVQAARAIEAERDRVFVDALTVLTERIAKRDRGLGRRLRSALGRRKGEPGAEVTDLDDDLAEAIAVMPEPTGATGTAADDAGETAAPAVMAVPKPRSATPAPRKAAAPKRTTKGAPKRATTARGKKSSARTPRAKATRAQPSSASAPRRTRSRAQAQRDARTTQTSAAQQAAPPSGEVHARDDHPVGSEEP